MLSIWRRVLTAGRQVGSFEDGTCPAGGWWCWVAVSEPSLVNCSRRVQSSPRHGTKGLLRVREQVDASPTSIKTDLGCWGTSQHQRDLHADTCGAWCGTVTVAQALWDVRWHSLPWQTCRSRAAPRSTLRRPGLGELRPVQQPTVLCMLDHDAW